MKKVPILTNSEIQQKTRRMAYQIVEDNYAEKELILIGIKPNGLEYAGQLKKQIEEINGTKVTLIGLTINKLKPLEDEINLELGKKSLDEKAVVIVDDVTNTGRTLYYALRPVMNFSPRKVQAAVLVDRQHKLFPISPILSVYPYLQPYRKILQ